MKPALSIAACILIAGCGASTASEPGTRPEPVETVSGDSDGRTIHLTRDAGVHRGLIDATPEEAWRQLAAVLVEMGLEATSFTAHIPAERRIEITNHRIRRLAGQPMSRFLNCGHSMGTPKTESGQLSINLKTWLEPANGGTHVNTRFDARVRSVGTSATATNCGTVGTFERQLAERLQERVLEARR